MALSSITYLIHFPDSQVQTPVGFIQCQNCQLLQSQKDLDKYTCCFLNYSVLLVQAQSLGRVGKQAASWAEGAFMGGNPDPAVMQPVLPPLPADQPWVRSPLAAASG